MRFRSGLILSVGAASLLASVAQGATGMMTIPAGTAIRAELTLLAAQGAVGRTNPFYKGYRPTFVFAGTKAEIMCAIELPEGQEKVDPGQTAAVTLRCIDPVSVQAEKSAFVFKEGGKLVGQGMLKP
jgi:translation elongation factor EF-Tu-like GTPase